MAIEPREKPKAVRRDDHTVHRRGAGKTVGVFLAIIILGNPVAVVQTVSLILSFDWMNAIALAVIIVGGIVIDLILIHIHDSQVWEKKIIGYYFHDFNDFLFEPTTIESLEQNLKRIRDVFRYPQALFLNRFSMPRIRAFYVYKKRKRRVLLSTLTTYQMAGGTSYVFLPWKPEKMDSVQRFNLLHEIGHAFITNRIIYSQGWFAVVYLCLLFVFVAFHREAGILALLVAFALAAMWAHHMEQQDNTYERLELAADTFALVHLAGRPDFLTTIARVARTFRKGSERARLLIQRAQILSRTGTESARERWSRA